MVAMTCQHSWFHLGFDEWTCEHCGTLASLGEPEDIADEDRAEAARNGETIN